MPHEPSNHWSAIRSLLVFLAIGLAIFFLLAAGVFWFSQIALPHPIAAIMLLLFAAVTLLCGLLVTTVTRLDQERRKQLERVHSLVQQNQDQVTHIEAATIGSQLFAERYEAMAVEHRQLHPEESSQSLTVIRSGLQILGIEHLASRWRFYDPKPEESNILYQHLLITLSVAQLEYPMARQLRFLGYFPGFKAEGGAFLLQSDQGLPIVLKFDSVANIEREHTRYQTCVKPKLTQTCGEPHVPLQEHGIIGGREWGAICYSFIGADERAITSVETFGETYRRMVRNEKTCLPLLQMLCQALKPWWTDRGLPPECERTRRHTLYGEYDRLSRRLTDMYEGLLGIDDPKLGVNLATAAPTETHLRLTPRLQVRNPLHWISNKFAKRQVGDWMNDDHLRVDSIVHGDLHSGNILFTQSRHDRNFSSDDIWMIDFAHTHVGPTIQDIARIEADIKFNLLDDAILDAKTPDEIYEFECQLTPEPSSGRASLADLTPLSPSTAGCYAGPAAAIAYLRTEARRYMMGDDPRPYYLALLHATMPNLYYRDRTARQKLHALMSSALLCSLLDR